MPTTLLKSTAFDAIETLLNTPKPTLTFKQQLDVLVNSPSAGPATVLQLSSSLIRVSLPFWDYSTGFPQKTSFEMRISGSGIGPVANLDQLMNAINDGLATGKLNSLQFLQGSTVVLGLTLDAGGYHLSSGDVAINLEGSLPLTFTKFADAAGLFDQLTNIATLTKTERLALFTDLTAYSASGLSVTEGGHTLFAAHISATTASLTLNGLTLTATGTFPSNFGQDIELLWDMFNSGSPLKISHVTGVSDLTMTSVTLKDAAGNLLGSVADPLAHSPDVTKVDGRTYDAVIVGDNGVDVLSGYARDRMVLAGLGGRDDLTGGRMADHLIGGSGNDTLNGNAGIDRINGGSGKDVMTGGSGSDQFIFNLGDGDDHITDFTAGTDVIQILAATRLSDLTFTEVGHDVKVDYRTIHITVEGITLAQLHLDANFQF